MGQSQGNCNFNWINMAFRSSVYQTVQCAPTIFFPQDNPLKNIDIKPVHSWSNKEAKCKLQFLHIAILFVRYGPKLNHYNKMRIFLWLSPVDSGAH